MRKIIILIVLFKSLLCLANITGQVADGTDNTPVIGASVCAYSSDSIFLNGVTTGTDGKFSIMNDLQHIGYIEVSCIGYDSLYIRHIGGDTLGVIRLYPKSHALSSVTVTADGRPQTATTETIFLSDSIRASALNAAMMIGNLPGFKVDWISENISIGNDKDVPVIVNGKRVALQYAKSINPKRIKSIQIQRYPPGEFSDCPVLINLVLFDNYIGWDIATNVSNLTSLRNKHSNSELAGADLTFSTRKWNTYLSTSYIRRQNYSASSFVRDILDVSIEESAPIDIEHPNIRMLSNTYSLSVGADRRIGNNHVLSFQGWFDRINSDNNENYDLTSGLRQSNMDDYESSNYVAGLFYRGNIRKKFSLKSSLLYNYYDINERRRFTENRVSSDTRTDGTKNYLFFSTDCSYTISNKWEATLGYNYTWRKYHNSVEDSGNDAFMSKENRNKINATVSFYPANTFNVRLGGDMLNISNMQNGISTSHISWLPRIQAYWRPARQIRTTLLYLNEIQYPNLDQLSPSSWEVSNNIIQAGNPMLKSKILHYAQTRITLFDFITLSYSYRKSNNDIVDWYEKMPDGKIKRTYINCDYLHQYLGLSFEKDLTNGFNLNFTGNYQWYKRWSEGAKNHGRTWYGDITGTWEIGKTNIMLMCEYFLRHDLEPLPQGMRYNQEEMLAFGMNYPFCKGKLPVSVLFTIPVNLIDKQVYTKINIPGFRSEIYGDDRINAFMFKINIRFNISKGKVRKEENSYVTDSEK